MLRPGGIAAVITSRFSLDSNDPGWRRRLADEVDLVAAFRLPSRTHREAGTDVVTDLLILRRPLPGRATDPSRTGWTSPSSRWTPTPPRPSTATGTPHPDHVLGRIEPGGAYRRENFNVVADRPAHEALADALADVHAVVGTGRARTGPRHPRTGPGTHRGRAGVAGRVDRRRRRLGDRVLPRRTRSTRARRSTATSCGCW